MGDPVETGLFGNEDWSLGPDGLEHRRTGYFIAQESLAARRTDRIWDWPMQMAEKSWCRPSQFREAFLNALDRFGIARDAELARSFALGFGMRASDPLPVEGFVRLGAVIAPERMRSDVARPERGRLAAGRTRAPALTEMASCA